MKSMLNRSAFQSLNVLRWTAMAAGLATATAAQAAVVTYDFNTAGQYTASFTANNGTVGAGNNFTQATTGGLNGSGSVTATASDNNGTSVDTADALNLTNSGMLTLAGYFTPTAVNGNGQGPGALFQLGLTATTSGSFGGTAAIDSLTGRVVAPASNTGATGNGISFTTSGGVAVVGTLTPVQVSLTAGNTYYLTISITPSATNATPGTSVAFSATESLYLANATTGALIGSPLASYAASFTDSTANAAAGGQLYGDATARFGFRGAQFPAAANGLAELGTGAVDNLSITTVPEPSTWALLVISLGLLGLTRRQLLRP